jgi:AsmA protein
MKKALIILASLIVVILLAVIVVPKLINWNGYKAKIAAMVQESTGRELRINGDIRLAIFPSLEFFVSDIHLSNAPGMQEPEMLSIGAVSGKLRLLPLISRRVVIDSFVIREPSVNLEVDKDGQANWVFGTESTSSTDSEEKPSSGRGGLPIKDLSLGEVRLSQGNLSFIDASTGQAIKAKDTNLTVALSNLGSPLTLELRSNLNDESVRVDLSVDSLKNMLEGLPATVNAVVASKFVTTGYQGSVQQEPVPGLNGTFNLDVPSVGQLAAWLGQPLDASQPDPGPLKVRATFEGDGAKVALTEATIEGSALKARATGSYDGSGDIAKVALNVESETLNIDRYLPPVPAEKKKTVSRKEQHDASGDIMAVFSQEPIDLSTLRKTEADVRIAIRGIKAMGFEIGQIDFTTNLKNGLLTADLNKLGLYGGNVNGTLKLDGSGEAMGVDAVLNIAGVKVDKLAKAVTGGEMPVAGVASGNFRATAHGASPRSLVKNLKGGIAFDLGGVDVKDAPVGAISEIKVRLDLPGIETSPSLKSSVVYNKRRVNLDLSTDPLTRVLSGDPFVLKALVDSKLVRLGYDGKVQQRPVPGLDGIFNLDIPSVGKLASWLGQPLDKSQPDPGPLKVRALFAGEGAKVTLKEATIAGKALQVRANGSYDGSNDIAKVALNVESETLDIDRYLPSAPVKKGKTAPKTTKSPSSGDPMAAISEEPFDLDGLKKTDADINIAIGGIKAMGYKIGQIAFTTSLKNGLLTADLHELKLYGGNVKGMFKLDGSGKALGVDAVLNIDGVKVDDLAQTAAGEGLAINGTASGNLMMQGKGISPKALVESLSGKVAFNLGGVDIKNATAGSISEMHVDLDLPGMESQSSIKGSVVYNKERVNLDLKLDSIKKALAGNAFAVKTAVDSKLLNVSYDGTAQQQPVPGLDGTFTLDVASVARLMQWLDQPLDSKQPDPGPLKLRATFEAQGSKAALKEATIEGKALQVKATGSLDNTGSVPVLTAKVHMEKADLNAYLPPSEEKKAAPEKQPKEKAAKQEPSGWSEEPLDLSQLSKANGDILIEIGSLRYKDITVQPGRIKAVLKNGVFDAAIEKFHVSGGIIASTLKLDASGKVAGLDYQLSMSGLEARPLLKTFANNDRLSGKTAFQAKGSAKGRNQKELVHSLHGDGQFKFLDGAIHGVNIPATLRKVKSLGFDKEAGEEVKTDFAELSGSFVIRDGVLANQDLKMLAPLLNLNGSGLVPLPQRAIDYDVTAELVATLEGQGRKDALAGLPIPIKVTGPWENISYKVDWKKAFGQISADPERLKNLPQNLRDASKSFGVNLPVPKLPDVLKLPDTGTGANPLNQLLPVKKESSQGTTGSTTTPEEKKEPLTLDPSKALKGLFNK